MRQWKRLVNPERLSGYRFRLRVFKSLEELTPELKELVEYRQAYHPRRTIVGTLSDVKPIWTVFSQGRYRPHLEAQRKPGQPWFACHIPDNWLDIRTKQSVATRMIGVLATEIRWALVPTAIKQQLAELFG